MSRFIQFLCWLVLSSSGVKVSQVKTIVQVLFMLLDMVYIGSPTSWLFYSYNEL